MGKRRQYMQKDQREQLARCIVKYAKAIGRSRRKGRAMKGGTEKRDETREGTPARVPYIGKPDKKRKCWRPERKR